MKIEDQVDNQDENMEEIPNDFAIESDSPDEEGVSEESEEDMVILAADTEESEEDMELGEEVSEEDLEISAIEPKPNSYTSTATAASLSLIARIEAIIFASSKCMKALDIFEVLEDESISIEDVQEQIDVLVETYNVRQGGFRLEYVRGHGYQFRTVAEAGCYMERLFASRPRPLSRAALETLSIVAYRQPVSRADIEFIRGVDSGSIVKNLLERALIRCVGRNEEVAGKPMVFGTTDEFLAVFRLNSLNELPPLASFQPPQDMVQSAEDQLEDADSEENMREEGDFVGVEGEDDPDVSEGLYADSDEDRPDLSNEDSESLDEYDELALDSEEAPLSDESPRIEGASLSDEPMDDPEESMVEEENEEEFSAEGVETEIPEEPTQDH